MHRASLAAVATVFAVGTLAGCGDLNSSDLTTSIDDYCAAIEDAKDDFDNLDSLDFTQFDEASDTIGGIADQAPDSVQDDWQLVDDRFGHVVDAFTDLGIDPADLDDPQALADIDPAKLADLRSVGQELNSPEVQQATEDINKEVREDCGIELGG